MFHFSIQYSARFDSDLFLKVNWELFAENQEACQTLEENGTHFVIHTYNRVSC